MGTITLTDLHKFFGSLHVIKGVDLEFSEGEFVVFVGPSGCGKSTMLRLIAGLEEVTEGKVEIDGRDVTGLNAAERGLAMVFQSYALYPHMTVRQNMGFGLKMAGVAGDKTVNTVNEVARTLQLEELLDRRPRELSGGQRQRVAIGRAIVRDPAAFLFDEPLSNLDAALRTQMRIEIARLHKKLKKTMIYVTHDQIEAMTLADRIVVFHDGVIQQQGGPMDLYEDPSNLFVATFIGSPKMNVIPCKSHPKGVELKNGGVISIPGVEGEVAYFGIRPEHIRLVDKKGALIGGEVGVAEHLGGDSFLHVDIDEADSVVVRVAGGSDVVEDEAVGLAFDINDAKLFGPDEERVKTKSDRDKSKSDGARATSGRRKRK